MQSVSKHDLGQGQISQKAINNESPYNGNKGSKLDLVIQTKKILNDSKEVTKSEFARTLMISQNSQHQQLNAMTDSQLMTKMRIEAKEIEEKLQFGQSQSPE